MPTHLLYLKDASPLAGTIQRQLSRTQLYELHPVRSLQEALHSARKVSPALVLWKATPADPIALISHRLKENIRAPILVLLEKPHSEILEGILIAQGLRGIEIPTTTVQLVAQIETLLSRHEILNQQRQNEAYFRLLLENSLEVIFVLDADYRIRFASPSLRLTLGYPPDQVFQRNFLEWLHPEDAPQAKDTLQWAVEHPESIQALRVRLQHLDGSWHIFEVFSKSRLQDEQIKGIILNSRDITEQQLVYNALRESQERFMLATLAANDGIWDWNIKSGRVYYSPRWKEILGFTEGEIGHRMEDWYARILPEDLDSFQSALNSLLSGATSRLECEIRMVLKDGGTVWVLVRGLAMRNREGEAYRIAGSMSDITERKQAIEQLTRAALYDTLTGLPNRTLLLDRLGMAIERSRRAGGTFGAVLFLDLDQFKVVNDSLGHPAGDEMLIQVGHRLQKCLRASDTLARFGGDEFVILLESVSSRRDVLQVADRVQHALSEPFEIAGRKVFTTVSMGIVIGLKQYNTREEVLQDADIAMYRAKSSGKARYVIFDATMRKRAINRLSLEMDLRHAIEQNHLYLVYQPILELQSGALIGFEALARWQHPEHGLILPADFIPIAEETSLIREVGRWVLREACRQFAPIFYQTKHIRPLVISINVSSRQITESGFVEYIRETLEGYRLPPTCLKLEITESALIESVDIARHVFHQLRQMGVDIHVDDFGTGYSSLSYIHRLPVDVIKIDQAFVQKLGEDEQSLEITRSILHMARSLGIKTVAEGIESQQQYLFLQQMACEYGQGYFLSQPMTIAQVEDFLKSLKDTPSAE